MSNATLYKYQRLYSVNRNFNPEFDSWIQEHYSITVGDKCWNYGVESFRALGEDENKLGCIKIDADVMQEYVRAGGRFYATDNDWFDNILTKGVRNVPKY